MTEYKAIIDREAAGSKEFYERQMKEEHTFDGGLPRRLEERLRSNPTHHSPLRRHGHTVSASRVVTATGPTPRPALIIITTTIADTFKDNMVLAITQREQDRVDAERQTKTLKVQVEDLSKSFEVSPRSVTLTLKIYHTVDSPRYRPLANSVTHST